MSVRSPAIALPGSPLHKLINLIEPKSVFLATVFFIVLAVLGYLTNPNEASFRAFLTELSFRRHLSKLHDPVSDAEDRIGTSTQNGVHYTSSRRDVIDQTSSVHSTNGVTTLPFRFHFAKRANVSLRTPAHIFRSFAIFTVAVVTPVNDVEPISLSTKLLLPPPQSFRPSQSLEGTWFIGAFGKWWVGGTVQVSGLEVIDLKSQEEIRAGIISMKALDRAPIMETNGGLSISQAVTPSRNPSSKKRRASIKNLSVDPTVHQSSRSATPPPLPKSVSLPLHAPRLPQANPIADTPTPVSTFKVATVAAQPTTVLPVTVDPILPASPRRSRSASHLAALDLNPVVADVLKQVTAAQLSSAEIRSQVNALRSSSSTAHSSLQIAVDSQREKKKDDDVVRNDLKSRTKTLDEAKRHAESQKRDADKHLKSAMTTKEQAEARVQKLNTEIEALQEKISGDVSSIVESGIKANAYEVEVSKTLELKKKEIKVAEDVIAALALRARELEDKVKDKRARLLAASETAETERKERQRRRSQAGHSVPLPNQVVSFQPTRGPQGPNNVVPSAPSQAQTSPEQDIIVTQTIHPIPTMPVQQTPAAPAVQKQTPAGPLVSVQKPLQVRGNSTPGLGLLQRRNIPSTAEPEPLSIDTAVSAKVETTRPRASSMSGNLDMGTLVEPPSSLGYTGFRTSVREARANTATLGAPVEDSLSSVPNGSLSRRGSAQRRAPSFTSVPPISTFSPFSDTDTIAASGGPPSRDSSEFGPISPFANSLIPTSLIQSLDAVEPEPLNHWPLPRPTVSQEMYFPPTGNGFVDGTGSRSRGNSIHAPQYSRLRRDSWSARTNIDYTHSHPVQAPSDLSPVFPGVATGHSSPESTIGSPPLLNSSPSSYTSPMGPPFGFAGNGHNVTFNTPSVHSLPALSPQTSRDSTRSLGMTEKDQTFFHRRWFMPSTSGKPQTHSDAKIGKVASPQNEGTKEKSKLNPDAKAFSFKGRTLLLPGLLNGSSGAHPPVSTGTMVPAHAIQQPPPPPAPMPAPATSFASRMYGSLVHPQATNTGVVGLPTNPTTPTSGSFFSSLMAFAPSPAESQALQNALGGWGIGGRGESGSYQNASQDYLPVGVPYHASAPSARSSAVDLPHQVANSTIWESTIPVPSNEHAIPQPPITSKGPHLKRSFSALWSRGKARGQTSTPNNGLADAHTNGVNGHSGEKDGHDVERMQNLNGKADAGQPSRISEELV